MLILQNIVQLSMSPAPCMSQSAMSKPGLHAGGGEGWGVYMLLHDMYHEVFSSIKVHHNMCNSVTYGIVI